MSLGPLVLSLAIVLTGCGSAAPRRTSGPATSPGGIGSGGSTSTASAGPGAGQGSQPATTATTAPSLGPGAMPSPLDGASPSPTLAAPFGWPAPTPPPPALTTRASLALGQAFDLAASKLKVPGAQATVLFANGFTWQGAYGWADIKAKRPMTSADLFDVGSITKTFISAEVLWLASQGRLALDDPLSRWLPAYPGAAAITIRELLSHTSGLADYFDNAKLLGLISANPAKRWTPQALLPYIGKPLFRPGTDWRYSNTNYLLLGLVVQAVEGRPVEAVLKDRFLDPLGLSQTDLQDAVDPAPSAQLGPIAEPYVRTGSGAAAFSDLSDGSGFLPYTSLATALGTAGAVISTSNDLAHWAAALYGGSVLPSGWLATMLDDQVTRPFHPARDYALGVEHMTLAELTTIGHSGACSGYRASMRYVPALGATVVVLINEDVLDPDVITARLIAAIEHNGTGAPSPA